MIVEKMTPQELQKEVHADYIQLLRKTDSLLPKMRRKAIKSKTKVAVTIIDYKSKNNNNWKLFIKSSKKYIDTFYYSVYDTPTGKNMIQIYNNGTIGHFSSHFLRRYRERLLKNDSMSVDEVVRFFIQHNSSTFMDSNVEEVGDRTNVFTRAKQGVLLGYILKKQSNYVIYYRTYISDDMLFDGQKNRSKPMMKVVKEQMAKYLQVA